jgi:uncharacterized cupin superfamily protein
MELTMHITIEKCDEETLQNRGVFGWPIWECEPSEFDWHYDQEETCYILEGEITVQTEGGEVHLGPGDYVTFPKGMGCIWKVTEPVRKHYTFQEESD